MSRMSNIIEIHEKDGDVVVQSGISWEGAPAAVRQHASKLAKRLIPI